MEKRFFTIREASQYSGLCRTTLYGASKRGELVLTKFGGATRIERQDLDQFLDVAGQKVTASVTKSGACE